tara:strand:+ start:6452 stop:6844 length:393 start_codon:yes stop_codon:yes gene_type:complete
MALVDLKKAELIALCEENELDTEGTKSELAERLDAVLTWDDEPEEVEEVVEEVVEEDYEHPPLPTLAEVTDIEDDEDIEVFINNIFKEYVKRDATEHELSHYRKAMTFHNNLTKENFVYGIKNSDEAKSQ